MYFFYLHSCKNNECEKKKKKVFSSFTGEQESLFKRTHKIIWKNQVIMKKMYKIFNGRDSYNSPCPRQMGNKLTYFSRLLT